MGELVKDAPFGVSKSAIKDKIELEKCNDADVPQETEKNVLADMEKALRERFNYSGAIDSTAPTPLKLIKILYLSRTLDLPPEVLVNVTHPLRVLEIAAKNMGFPLAPTHLHDANDASKIVGIIIGGEKLTKEILSKLNVESIEPKGK